MSEPVVAIGAWLLRVTAWLRMAVVLALGGCFVAGPDYEPPIVIAPESWDSELRRGLYRGAPTPAQWWRNLDDPMLSALIDRAAAANPDLQRAQARIREARARRGIARADLYPTLDLAGSATASRGSESSGTGERRELYRTGFDAGWELDVFGGVRRSIEAADREFEATAADYHDVLVSLLAEVALNYVELRTLQAQIEVAEKNLKAQSETLQLTEWRLAAGLVSQLDVDQARSSLENTRALLPRLRADLAAAKNRLAVLLGAYPGALDIELAAEKPVPEAPLEIAVGVPAEALRQRADVRRAERQLAAQTARIGVAVADLYPRFSLPGSIGLEALSGNPFFAAGSRFWSIVAGVAWPLFRGGAIRSNIEVQSALQEQRLREYEGTILIALEEVENALTAFAQEQDRLDALRQAVQSAASAVELAQTQYLSGLIDFQSVLDAQRVLLTAQDQLAQSRGQVTANLIRLYKALGGGWAPLAP